MSGGGAPAAASARVSAVPIAEPKSVGGSTAAMRVLPWAMTDPTSRRTCCAGVMPSVQTPGRACAGSLVNASTAIPAACAGAATAAVSVAVSGPMISPAPAAIAALAAAAAPGPVPPVSRTSRCGLPGADSASCAACTKACPRSAFGPVSGASSATDPPVGLPPGASDAPGTSDAGPFWPGPYPEGTTSQPVSARMPVRSRNARRNMPRTSR